MPNTQPDLRAIVRGEQRSPRFRYRHTVAAAAQAIGVPPSWIWSWLLAGRLKAQKWLRCIWVRLADAQAQFRNRKAVEDAYYATGEPISSPEAVREVLRRWPGLYKAMYVSATSGDAPAPIEIRRAA